MYGFYKHSGIERCINGRICAAASSQTRLSCMHRAGRMSRQTHLAGCISTQTLLPKRIQTSTYSTFGLIWACFQLDASGIYASGWTRLGRDASSQMGLARHASRKDASSWMHLHRRVHGCIFQFRYEVALVSVILCVNKNLLGDILRFREKNKNLHCVKIKLTKIGQGT